MIVVRLDSASFKYTNAKHQQKCGEQIYQLEHVGSPVGAPVPPNGGCGIPVPSGCPQPDPDDDGPGPVQARHLTPRKTALAGGGPVQEV